MRRELFLFTLVGCLIFASGGMGADRGDLIELVGNGEIQWSEGVILAKGSGAPPKEARNIAQARLMAERAALVDARRNLLEVVKGVWVNSSTRVENFMVKSDEIRLKTEGLIQGSAEIRHLRRYLADGGIEVAVAMSLKGDFLGLVLSPPVEQPAPKPQAVEPPRPLPPAGKKPEPAPDSTPSSPLVEKPGIESKPQPPSPLPAKGLPEKPALEPKTPPKEEELPKYTGLVIDARGLNMRPALIPKIFDASGQELYQGSYVPSEKAAQNGLVLYSRDLTAAQTHPRVGKNPLTVKGLKIKAPALSDIVLRGEDSPKVRPFARGGTFLEECKVMIVVD